MSIDHYERIRGGAKAEIKIKGSEFIAEAAQAATKEDAERFWKEMKSLHYDATHNCMAYRIGPDGMEFRYSDDGEPNGSAGKPIFFMIEKSALYDTVVNVTRYFGGTKLGVGGLVRAYGEAAELALDKCTRETVHLTKAVIVDCSYEEISAMKRLIDEYALDFSEQYTDIVQFRINVAQSKAEQFIREVESSTLGRAKSTLINEIEQVCK